MDPNMISGAASASNPWLAGASALGNTLGSMGQGPDTLQSHAGGAPITVGGLTIERTSWTMVAAFAAVAVAAVMILRK